jgi:hypothetical protein
MGGLQDHPSGAQSADELTGRVRHGVDLHDVSLPAWRDGVAARKLPTMSPDPLVISWRGRQLRVRHNDPCIGPYSPVGQRIRAAIELATDVEGLRLVLASTVGEQYIVRVAEDGGDGWIVEARMRSDPDD